MLSRDAGVKSEDAAWFATASKRLHDMGEHRTGSPRPARSRCLRFALLFSAWMHHGAGYAQVTSPSVVQRHAPPPLYRSLALQRQPAQSMIYGPGTINGGPLPGRETPLALRPALVPQCRRAPQENDLQSYSGLQTVTAEQTRRLGIVLRSRTGEAKPFLGGRAVLWRSGRYALCEDEAHRTLVYGAEWAVAFLLQDSASPSPATLDELASTVEQGHLLALGSVANGEPDQTQLAEQINGLAAGWAMSEEILLQRFAALRSVWPRDRMTVNLATPIGIAVP